MLWTNRHHPETRNRSSDVLETYFLSKRAKVISCFCLFELISQELYLPTRFESKDSLAVIIPYYTLYLGTVDAFALLQVPRTPHSFRVLVYLPVACPQVIYPGDQRSTSASTLAHSGPLWPHFSSIQPWSHWPSAIVHLVHPTCWLYLSAQLVSFWSGTTLIDTIILLFNIFAN